MSEGEKRTERCETCRFWLGYGFELRGTDKVVTDEGECRRFPPQTYWHGEDQTVVEFFPKTQDVEWCGEWRGEELQDLPGAIRVDGFEIPRCTSLEGGCMLPDGHDGPHRDANGNQWSYTGDNP